jgi:restriction endonuclease Mrr
VEDSPEELGDHRPLQGRKPMHAVTRTYSGPGASELFDRILKASDEVEGLLRGVTGFVSYTLFRSGDGGVTVTVCQDKAGTDESLQVARDWVATNASDVGVSAPTVSEGPVGMHLSE